MLVTWGQVDFMRLYDKAHLSFLERSDTQFSYWKVWSALRLSTYKHAPTHTEPGHCFTSDRGEVHGTFPVVLHQWEHQLEILRKTITSHQPTMSVVFTCPQERVIVRSFYCHCPTGLWEGWGFQKHIRYHKPSWSDHESGDTAKWQGRTSRSQLQIQGLINNHDIKPRLTPSHGRVAQGQELNHF